jgi:hypothetical protein
MTDLDFKELLDLIAIRNYVVNSVANPIFDRATVKELDGILILLDKKISLMLTSAEFKEYIGFAGLKQTIREIKSETDRPFHEARAIMSGIRPVVKK